METDTFPGFDTTDIGFTEASTEEEAQLELQAPKFDFDTAKVLLNPLGQVINGDALDAYRFWVAKCLLTERYKYLAYSSDFGVEVEAIMTAAYPRDIAQSELERTITEALEADERTVGMGDFQFAWSGDALSITFTIESVYGTETYNYEAGGEEIGRVRIQAAG